MKNTIAITTLIGGLTLAGSTARAFDSGSDGSYGAINITTNTTLVVPPNGIFNCTTITVASNATLTFTANSLNTPVYLLAQGDIVVNGIIDVSGQDGRLNGANSAGGPGGFDGGAGVNTSTERYSGKGQGPGGGAAGTLSTTGGAGSFAYGNLLLVPLQGGSGGGGCAITTPGGSGGGGGGAVLLGSSSDVRITGTIRSLGGANCSYGGPGSGGGIRIVAPVVSGSGKLDVSPNGRIRVDCLPPNVSLSLVGGANSVGRSMFVFPPNNPRLYFVNAAGWPINPAAQSAVNISIPGTNGITQDFMLRGENFLGDVPVKVVSVPDAGPGFTNNIVMHFPTDRFTNVTVTVPLTLSTNQNNHINAYAMYGLLP